MLEAPAASSRKDEDGDERQGENFTLQIGESPLLLLSQSSVVMRCSVRNPLMVILNFDFLCGLADGVKGSKLGSEPFSIYCHRESKPPTILLMNNID